MGVPSAGQVGTGTKSPAGGYNRTRLETNLLRLLTRTETMAMDTETVAVNWRLDKVEI